MMALTLATLKSSVVAMTHAVAPWYDEAMASAGHPAPHHSRKPMPAYGAPAEAAPPIVPLAARRTYRAAQYRTAQCRTVQCRTVQYRAAQYRVAPAGPTGGGTTDIRFGRNSKQMEELRRQQTVFIGAVTSGSTAIPALLGITLNGNVVSGYLIVKRADSESAGPVTGVKEGKRLILHAPLGAEQEKVDLLLDYGPLVARGALTRSSAPDQADTVQFRRAS